MKAYLVLLMFGAAALAPAQKEVRLFAGEQPPLISSKGGIIDMVAVASLRAAGYTAKIEWLPIGRMLAMLQQDGLDHYITASNTPGQQNQHQSFLEARGVFFYKKSKFPELKAERLEDLAGHRVATVLNSPNTPIFTKAGIIVDEGPNDTWFQKLDVGRVDFTATADVGGVLTIRSLFPDRESEFTFTDLAYTNISAGVYAKDDPEFIEALKNGFANIKADGTLDAMLKSFFGAENWRRVRILP